MISIRLNVVRPGRPEQLDLRYLPSTDALWSQCSPAWKTGTILPAGLVYTAEGIVSM